jgi:hypothetical protein
VLRWVVDTINAGGTDNAEARLDRVHWSRDAAPRFDSLTFDHEAAPGSAIAWTVTSDNVSAFDSSDLPAWLTFDPATGIISGSAPALEGTYAFSLTIQHEGRCDVAGFRLSIRPPLESVAGGQWFRQPYSLWLTAGDGAGGSLLALSPAAGDGNYREELRLAVQAPCLVTFRTLVAFETVQPSLLVRADQLSSEAWVHRWSNGGWQRSIVAVPGSGTAFVYFDGSRDACCGTLQLDDVKVFPWHSDANNDGLTNGMACALARWPDAVSEGDPLFLLTPHPVLPGFQQVCFGSGAGDPALFATRDHAVRLLLEEGHALSALQAATATVEPSGAFAACWKIPAPTAPRTFYRVQALPLTNGN